MHCVVGQKNLSIVHAPSLRDDDKHQTLGARGKVGNGGSVPVIFTTEVAAEDCICGARPWSDIGVITWSEIT